MIDILTLIMISELITREGDPHSKLKAIACLGVILQV